MILQHCNFAKLQLCKIATLQLCNFGTLQLCRFLTYQHCNIVTFQHGNIASWTDQLDIPAGWTSWMDQPDGPAGWISRTDQLDGPAGRTSCHTRVKKRLFRGEAWNFDSYLYIFCPNNLKKGYYGKFGCFFNIPKFLRLNSYILFVILRNQP